MPRSKSNRILPNILHYARDLRRNLTPAEQKLWAVLRLKQIEGYRFRRQTPMGMYIVDFYCPAVKLIVEIDGGSHADREIMDQDRTNWLNSQGYRVIRFTNYEVMHNLNDVVREIVEVCREQERVLPPSRPSPLQGEGD